MSKVLVTGATKGIGLAIAKRFADEGHEVIALGRSFEEFPLDGKNVSRVTFDLSNVTEIPALVEKIGDIDILVNNAGIMNGKEYGIDHYPEEKKRLILAVNIEAPVALMSGFGALMAKKGRGRIVNITSVAGTTGHPDVWYGITKAALLNATKTFARGLGKNGVAVNAVSPGPVDTEMLESIASERLEDFKRMSQTGKFSSPEEIAEIAYWLATDAPDSVRGAAIDANGGVFMR